MRCPASLWRASAGRDDEVEILEGMRTLLERWQCTVVTAASGQELREQPAASTQAPALLICDYRLRDGESGPDVVALLRDEFNREIPALLITGDTDPRLRDVESATLSLLHKPVQPARLRAAMRLFLRDTPSPDALPDAPVTTLPTWPRGPTAAPPEQPACG
jgi:CheY-like chemotaxis protein